MTAAPSLINAPEYTVSELSSALKRTVEDTFGHVRVRGEISGFKRHASGHCYFTLKDENACIDAVIWRTSAGALAFRPEDGADQTGEGVLARVRLEYWISFCRDATSPRLLGNSPRALQRST